MQPMTNNKAFFNVGQHIKERFINLGFRSGHDMGASCGALSRAIHLTPMANLNHQNHQNFILNITNDPNIANAVSPVGSHPWPNQIFTCHSRVNQSCDPLVHVVKNSLRYRLIQLFKLAQ
jgi:hypothetical protein